MTQDSSIAIQANAEIVPKSHKQFYETVFSLAWMLGE